MLKSVNLSVLTPLIMQDISQTNATGGSLQLNPKVSRFTVAGPLWKVAVRLFLPVP